MIQCLTVSSSLTRRLHTPLGPIPLSESVPVLFAFFNPRVLGAHGGAGYTSRAFKSPTLNLMPNCSCSSPRGRTLAEPGPLSARSRRTAHSGQAAPAALATTARGADWVRPPASGVVCLAALASGRRADLRGAGPVR